MNDEEIIQELIAASQTMAATKLAELLDELSNGGLSQGSMITYFKRAFPAIPLRTLRDAGGWRRLTRGGFSDAEFNAMLSQWVPTRGDSQ